MNDVIKHKIKHNAHRALVSVKWVIFAILVGGISLFALLSDTFFSDAGF